MTAGSGVELSVAPMTWKVAVRVSPPLTAVTVMVRFARSEPMPTSALTTPWSSVDGPLTVATAPLLTLNVTGIEANATTAGAGGRGDRRDLAAAVVGQAGDRRTGGILQLQGQLGRDRIGRRGIRRPAEWRRADPAAAAARGQGKGRAHQQRAAHPMQEIEVHVQLHGCCFLDQRAAERSVTILGVMNTSSSVLRDVRVVFLNR